MELSSKKFIQIHFIGILKSLAASLAVDERTLYVGGEFPADSFSSKAIPRICVERPVAVENKPYSSSEYREVLSVTLLLLDAAKPTHQDRENDLSDALERLDLLASRVVEVIRENTTNYLKAYSAFEHFLEFDISAEKLSLGSDLIGQEITVTIPLIVANGYGFDSSYAFGYGEYDYFNLLG